MKATARRLPYIKVPYGELEEYVQNTASSLNVNYIEVTGEIPVADFKGSNSNQGALGQKLKDHSDKKVALKIANYLAGLTDMNFCFYGCTKLPGVMLKCNYNPAEISGDQAFAKAFKNCDTLGNGSIKVSAAYYNDYIANAGVIGTTSLKFAKIITP